MTDSYEVRACSYKTAKSALDLIKAQYSADTFTEEWEILDAENLFDFKNVENNTKRLSKNKEEGSSKLLF